MKRLQKVASEKIKNVSFDITNKAEDYRILYLEPLGLKYGMDPQDCYTLVIHGEAPFEMYLGDDSESIHIEFIGEIAFSLMDGDELLRSGHNLRF